LIVKRITTRIAESPILGTAWGGYRPETRESVVDEFRRIAAEVLGEEVEPDPLRQLDFALRSLGSKEVMEHAAANFAALAGDSACTIGPRREDLVMCECDDDHCEWCCETGKLTHRVKQAKDEHEHPPKPTEKKGEQMEWDHWDEIVNTEGPAYCFIENMRRLGAVRIDVPASKSGSFSVEFERGKPPATPDPGGGDEDGCTP